DFRESINLVVDGWFDAVRVDGAHHVLEHFAAAAGRGDEADGLRHDAAEFQRRAAAADHTDHRDRAAGAHRANRLVQRRGATQLDHQIGAATDALPHDAAPFGMRLVVNADV